MRPWVFLVWVVLGGGCLGILEDGTGADVGAEGGVAGGSQQSGGGTAGQQGGGGGPGGGQTVGGGVGTGGGQNKGGGGTGGGRPVGGGGGTGGGQNRGGGTGGGQPVGGGTAVAGFSPGPSGCNALTVDHGVSLSGYQSDRYTWSDGACVARSAGLVRNDASDPGGSQGGFLRELVWTGGGVARTARGNSSSGWNGWGYIVDHYGSTADDSLVHSGSYRTVFAGANHAIHEFTVRENPGGPVDVTIHWFFSSGKSAPAYAITFDSSPAGTNVVNADTRAPYGDLSFEGTEGEIGGLGWGDKYRFVTTGTGPVTFATPWDYTQPNVVPYVHMWSMGVDAEMGVVQTQSFEQHLAGGDYGAGLLAANCWGKTSATQGPSCSTSGQTMPTDWLWPFQLNQYNIPYGTTSHRLAWGSNYGAVGQQTVSAFGKTISGFPKMSYSVYMVIDPKTAHPTLAQAAEVEHVIGAQLTASVGTVLTQGPAGVGRTDPATYAPAGYSPLYGTWELAAAGGAVTATLDPKAGSLKAPVFHVTGFTKSQASVSLGGAVLPASVALVSIDAANGELWLTLNGTVNAPVTIHIE